MKNVQCIVEENFSPARFTRHIYIVVYTCDMRHCNQIKNYSSEFYKIENYERYKTYKIKFADIN